MEADVAEGLKVRHDHGPAYLSDDFQREIAYLGMTSSPSFVRAPEGNGYCEWFIRILKENLLWVRSFATVEELRWALLEFNEPVQPSLDSRGLRLPNAGPGKAGKTRSSCGGRMRSNTLTRVSNNPGAVQPAFSHPCRKAKGRVHRYPSRLAGCGKTPKMGIPATDFQNVPLSGCISPLRAPVQ